MRKTDEEIEEHASRFRAFIGIAGQVHPDMMTVIAKLKHEFKGFDYLRVPVEQMPDDEAQFDGDKKLLLLREDTFRAMQRGEPRARFTVAHEIGHFALGHQGLRNRSTIRKASEKARARVMEDESEASRFAAAFLVPRELASGRVTKEFGVSGKAAAIRQEALDRMARRSRGEQRRLPDSVLEYLREGKKRGLKPKTDTDHD